MATPITHVVVDSLIDQVVAHDQNGYIFTADTARAYARKRLEGYKLDVRTNEGIPVVNVCTLERVVDDNPYLIDGQDRHGVPLAVGDHVLVVPLGRETTLPYTAVINSDGFEWANGRPMGFTTPDSAFLRNYYRDVAHLPTFLGRLMRITAEEAERFNAYELNEEFADALLRRALS